MRPFASTSLPRPAAATGGSLSSDTATWSAPGPANKNLTNLGTVLTRRGFVPEAAKDGTS